ncbi:MAG TPA: hypothetical protein VHW60_07025 [Caulobacteraceae bacterium]|jgi:hypothetical protein|nr:hypothetical protein [Caulobacteraceae bacterium]
MTAQPPEPPAPTPTFGASPTPIAPPASNPAMTSFACGVIAILIGWVPVIGLIGAGLAIVALVTGIIGVRQPNGRGYAIGGIVCAALVFLPWMVLLIAVAVTRLSAAHA